MTDSDSVTIRPATRADYPAIAAVVSIVQPQHPVTAETLERQTERLLADPQQLHLMEWVAEVGGQVYGQAVVYHQTGMFHPDRYWAEVMVVPRAQGMGIGGALAREVEEHLRSRGAKEVESGAYEDDGLSLRFLIDRDFVETMRYFDNVLELEKFDFGTWEERVALPEGVRAVSLAGLIDERGEKVAVQAFFAAFNEARLDVPRTGEATELSAEAFAKRLEDPTYYREGTWLAVDSTGEVVALTELWKNDAQPGRLDIGLTGTRRAWRRKGLSLALKLRAMQVAHSAGYRELWTGNATTNAPMLALNERLGFKPRPAFIGFRWGKIKEGARA